MKKYGSFKWILFCCLGHLAYILYHILYLENKLMDKIQVNSLPCSPSSCIMEPMATVVNYVNIIRFSQQLHAGTHEPGCSNGGCLVGWVEVCTSLIISATKMCSYLELTRSYVGFQPIRKSPTIQVFIDCVGSVQRWSYTGGEDLKAVGWVTARSIHRR